VARKTTVIIIAHRLSTIINCDNIYVIDNGSVVESGRYQELMSRKGKFFELAGVQNVS
jgi:ABC-type multidrug transport system fused ATPase/permease subunit